MKCRKYPNRAAASMALSVLSAQRSPPERSCLASHVAKSRAIKAADWINQHMVGMRIREKGCRVAYKVRDSCELHLPIGIEIDELDLSSMQGLHMSDLILNPFRFLGIGAIAEKKSTDPTQWVHALHDQQGSLAIVAGFSRVISSFANHLRRLFIIAHGDEGAMPQMPSIGPFNKRDLADQFRCDPAAFFHLFSSQRLAPPGGPFLGQILERATDNAQLF